MCEYLSMRYHLFGDIVHLRATKMIVVSLAQNAPDF